MIVTGATTQGRCFNEHGKDEMPVNHQIDNPHKQHQQQFQPFHNLA